MKHSLLQIFALVVGVFNVALGGAGSQPVSDTAVNDLGFAFGSAERYLQTTVVSAKTRLLNSKI